MTGVWATLLPTLVSAILGGGLVAGYVSLRRLKGQRGIDAAQRDSLISEAAGRVVAMTAEQLGGCQRECDRLRARMDLMDGHIRQLESIMRTAGLPLPVRPSTGGPDGINGVR